MVVEEAAENQLWDVATRFFHWNLVLVLMLLWWSAETARLDLHESAGIYLLSLLIWRIYLGFFGSKSSKFREFVLGPGQVGAYLRGLTTSREGHNPLGGWMIILMLLTLVVQAVTGLFNSDDVFFYGPLYFVATDGFLGLAGEIHAVMFCIILSLAAMHVIAVFWHQTFKKRPLIQAMVLGKSIGRIGLEKPTSQARAFFALIVIYLTVNFGLSKAPGPVSFF